MSKRKPKRFQSKSASIVLVLVSFFISSILALVLLELLVRLNYPIITLYRYSPGPDYVMEPNRKVKFVKDEFRTEINTNSFGLRDDEPASLNDERILLLGDSYTFGHGVEHHETFGYLLESSLSRSLQQDVEIVNAGHNGYDTRRETAYLKEYGLEFEPSMIMVGFVINDVLSNSGEYFFSPISLGAFRNCPLRSIQSLAEYLKKPAMLFRKLGFTIDTPNGAEIDHFDCLRENTKCDAGWQATYSYVSEIMRFARRSGVPVLIVNIPVLDQIQDNPKKDAYNRTLASEKLEQMTNDLGAHFVDLSKCEGLDESSYFKKDGHWNADGHAAAAACIDRQFRSKWVSNVMPQ